MNALIRICYFCIILNFAYCSADSEWITIKNESGNAIRCKVEGFKDGQVHLKRDDGMRFQYAYELLDKTSMELVKERVIALHPPSINVKSIANSRSETDVSVPVSEFGSNQMPVIFKKRKWRVNVSTHSPFAEKVSVEIYYFNEGSVTRERKEGSVKYEQDWTIDLENESYGKSSADGDTDSGYMIDKDERVRIDLIIYLRDSKNRIVDSYATSRHAQLELEKHIPGLRQ